MTILLSEVYDVVHKDRRGKAKEGFFRPTIGESFMSNKEFVEIISNNPPVANPDSAECDENSSVIINLLANDTDLDGDTLTIATLTAPAHGTLENPEDGTVTYTPVVDYVGNDSFDYTISDGKAEVTSTASITINPVIFLEMAGTSKLFKSNSVRYDSVTGLSDTKAILFYRDDTNDSKGTACVLDIQGSTFIVGDSVVFNDSNYSDNIVSTTLSPTKAIVACRDTSIISNGIAIYVINITGSVISSVGPKLSINEASYGMAFTVLSETKAIFTRNGVMYVLTISGSTITAGNPASLGIIDSNSAALTTLSDTKALMTYKNGSNSDYGTTCVLDISGNTITTTGNREVFQQLNTTPQTVMTLSPTKSLVICQGDGSLKAIIINIVGSTVTVGTPYLFGIYSTYLAATLLSDTKVLVAYSDSENNFYGTACVLNINGATITSNTPLVFENSRPFYISLSTLSSTKAVVAYSDFSNNYYGKACILY